MREFGLHISAAKSSREKCKSSGEPFSKGENLLSIVYVPREDKADSANNVKLSEAGAVLHPLLELFAVHNPLCVSDFHGYDLLSDTDKVAFSWVLEGKLPAVAASSAQKRKVRDDDDESSSGNGVEEKEHTEAVKMAKKKRTHESDAPGWCSTPSNALSADQIRAITSFEGDAALSEKALIKGSKGRRKLVQEGCYLAEWAGDRTTRFLSKDATRFMAMADAAKERENENADCTAVVLIAHDGGICCRNALKQLIEAGVMVQRCCE